VKQKSAACVGDRAEEEVKGLEDVRMWKKTVNRIWNDAMPRIDP
jgi:hypothetical protein